MTDKTKQRRLITADLLDAVDKLIDECTYTDDGRPAVSRHTLERAVKAFNVAHDQWTNEAKELGMPQAFQCILCNFTYLDEANRDKCFAQHRHAIETQTDDPDDLSVTLDEPYAIHYRGLDGDAPYALGNKDYTTTLPTRCKNRECSVLIKSNSDWNMEHGIYDGFNWSHPKCVNCGAFLPSDEKAQTADDSEDLPVTLEQSNESLEHAINTVCNTTTRLAIDAEYRKQIKMRYEADRAKTFTFHLPAHDHDEIRVHAPDVATAREMLYDWVERGRYAGEEVVVLRENTDDGSARHWKEEVNDAPAFDENGEQIDN